MGSLFWGPDPLPMRSGRDLKTLMTLASKARRSGRSFLARGWRRQGQLVKMQSWEICCDQVGRVAQVAYTGASRNRELDRLLERQTLGAGANWLNSRLTHNRLFPGRHAAAT